MKKESKLVRVTEVLTRRLYLCYRNVLFGGVPVAHIENRSLNLLNLRTNYIKQQKQCGRVEGLGESKPRFKDFFEGNYFRAHFSH